MGALFPAPAPPAWGCALERGMTRARVGGGGPLPGGRVRSRPLPTPPGLPSPPSRVPDLEEDGTLQPRQRGTWTEKESGPSPGATLSQEGEVRSTGTSPLGNPVGR